MTDKQQAARTAAITRFPWFAKGCGVYNEDPAKEKPGTPMGESLIADTGIDGDEQATIDQEARAVFIAEAGTVFYETGMTPRQLANECAKLALIEKEIAETLDAPTLIDAKANCRNLTKSMQAIEAIVKSRSTIREAFSSAMDRADVNMEFANVQAQKFQEAAADRDRLKEVNARLFGALVGVLFQLDQIGVREWHGAEGLDLSEARAAVAEEVLP